jgi:hypothetical protein
MQQVHIVRETPALYERIVKPYIDAFPASRTQWLVWGPSILLRVFSRLIHRSWIQAFS